MSLTCSASFFSGLFTRNGPFIRTPKKGDRAGTENVFYRAKFDNFSLVEITVGIAYLFFAYLAMKRGMWFEPIFFLCFAISYLAVGISSFYDSFYVPWEPINVGNLFGRVRALNLSIPVRWIS